MFKLSIIALYRIKPKHGVCSLVHPWNTSAIIILITVCFAVFSPQGTFYFTKQINYTEKLKQRDSVKLYATEFNYTVINGRTKTAKHNGLDGMISYQHRTQTGRTAKETEKTTVTVSFFVSMYSVDKMLCPHSVTVTVHKFLFRYQIVYKNWKFQCIWDRESIYIRVEYEQEMQMWISQYGFFIYNC
jgi:hypothetical protein